MCLFGFYEEIWSCWFTRRDSPTQVVFRFFMFLLLNCFSCILSFYFGVLEMFLEYGRVSCLLLLDIRLLLVLARLGGISRKKEDI